MLFVIIIFGLLWGSFLNVLAYRSMNNVSVATPRSYCPYCKRTIAWYDNIPVFSWVMLQGRCRTCKQPISLLYPFIEIITACLFALVYLMQPDYFIPYAFFVSALIVTIRTDIEYMLIHRMFSLALIPIAWMCAFFELLPITLMQSIIGTIFGYSLLFVFAKLFFVITKKEGMGEGDFDLLAYIGSFTGVYGVCITLLVSSWAGSLYGICYMLWNKKRSDVAIPFGPFLVLGAVVFILFQNYIYAHTIVDHLA